MSQEQGRSETRSTREPVEKTTRKEIMLTG